MGEETMSRFAGRIAVLFAVLFALACGPGIARAQQLEAAGADAVGALCFQCHRATMWSDFRADRQGWERVLYRMVGRGALWTEDEIRSMAAYLASALGPQSAQPSK
jgi:hypothetical protein